MPEKSSFRICSKCRAYNTVHVLRCYKCAGDLPRVVVRNLVPEEDRKYKNAPADSRAAERSSLGVIGAVLEVNGEIRHDVLIEDISQSGMLFHSEIEYLTHDRFTMLIPLEDEHYVVEVSARRCQNVRFSQWQYTVGAEFVNADRALIDHVGRLCGRGSKSYSIV